MYLISPNYFELGTPNVEIKNFPDGDLYVKINKIEDCQGEDVVFFHRLYPDQNNSIFSALLVLDTLKREGARVTLVSPYLPYSRQDKTFKQGEALSAQVLCKMLGHAGATKLVTLDCHFLKKEGEFDYRGLTIKNVSASRLIVEHTRSLLGLEGLEVISPDEGASHLVSEFGGKSMHKERGEYAKGEEAYRSIEKIERTFEVKDQNILILDDMISTGSTMIKAVENVKKGGAKKVFCGATHGLFLKDSLTKLKGMCNGVFTTNSIANQAATVDIKDLIEKALS